MVSGAARGQALRGPMWAGLTPDSKGDPTGDTEEPDRRRQETPHLSARRKGALPASPGGPPSTGQKKLRVLNPILRLYQIQSTGKSFRMRVEMCWGLVSIPGSFGTLKSQVPQGSIYPTGTRFHIPDFSLISGSPGDKASTRSRGPVTRVTCHGNQDSPLA